MQITIVIQNYNMRTRIHYEAWIVKWFMQVHNGGEPATLVVLKATVVVGLLQQHCTVVATGSSSRDGKHVKLMFMCWHIHPILPTDTHKLPSGIALFDTNSQCYSESAGVCW